MQFKCQKTSISGNSVLHKYTVKFYCPIDRTLLGATTPGQSGHGDDCSKGELTFRMFCVISRILVGGGGGHSSAEMQSVYSIVQADWANDVPGYFAYS